ncbi:hypothetical protein [Adhaeribacter pallidiroseus]|uniref:Uncharacterized protein n=1 Tax=Adhaeribacter pallidiroseus TaxID=2072847 RepID=A0A369QKV6_9BACT|nr:hypothetical protein [Adhaeribacter pallidiroseus]RDC64970.1 hypothetical protein AHMF7616_03592 [Adhaeribacter pallidiroseus]
MKKIRQTLKQFGLVLILGTALSFSACSTGTKDGDTNVEDSGAKDKDPENMNNTETEVSGRPDSLDMDKNKTYQKVDPDSGARDADNDGKVDQ